MNSTSPADSTDIRIENGLIRFDGYQLYKQRAEEARDFLLTLDVNPDSEQECKRTVATARKISEKLNQEKIRIKKEVLAPYTDFENKVKEIIGIITEGEDVARDKLKAIDDNRREAKKEEIRKIWDKRKWSFISGQIIPFEKFLQDRHLNKTVPISEVESEMTDFFLTTSEEITFLESYPLETEYIEEYLQNGFNVTRAMQTVDKRHETIKEIAQDPYMVIRITGKADIILAKQLLKDVNYKVLEEN